jgi:hypothetical protein
MILTHQCILTNGIWSQFLLLKAHVAQNTGLADPRADNHVAANLFKSFNPSLLLAPGPHFGSSDRRAADRISLSFDEWN